MKEHLALLGMKVRDRVTGFAGVVTSVSFDLYGCVQAAVMPGLNDKGQPGEGSWYDTKRLEITDHDPVMEIPTFAIVPGGQALPAYRSQPAR